MKNYQVKPAGAETAQKSETEAGRVSLKESLMALRKPELWELAGELDMSGYRRLKKEPLAEAVRDELLRPSVMESRLIFFNDSEIDALEEAIEKDCCYLPDESVMGLMDRLYQMNYLVMFEDDHVDVPREVAAVYAQISTPQFHALRQKVAWLYDCLLTAGFLYISAPLEILYRMYAKGDFGELDRGTFNELFSRIPYIYNPSVVRDGKVIHKPALVDGIFLEIEDLQGDREFYIPTYGEIREYADKGYPASEPGYRRFKEFLMKRSVFDSDETDLLLSLLWKHLSMGAEQDDVEELLSEAGLGDLEGEEKKEFSGIFGEISARTRMVQYRGFMPCEEAG